MTSITYIGKYNKGQIKIFDFDYDPTKIDISHIESFEIFKQNSIEKYGSPISIYVSILPLSAKKCTAFTHGKTVYSGINFVDAISALKESIGISNKEIMKKIPKKYYDILNEQIKEYKNNLNV